VKARLIATTGLILTLCSSANAADPLVIDSLWNVDFAKEHCEKNKQWLRENRSQINQFGCDAVTSCPELMPSAIECQTDGAAERDVTHFENEIMTRLASNPLCSGVEVVRYEGPKTPVSDKLNEISSNPRHWALMLNFMPGVEKQYWGMSGPNTNAPEGQGNASEIADSVCTIVGGHGAKILN
jgi:hypothetical protein